MDKDVREVEKQIRTLRNQSVKVKIKMRKLPSAEGKKYKDELKDLRRKIQVLREKQREVIREKSKEVTKEIQKILSQQNKEKSTPDIYNKRVIKL